MKKLLGTLALLSFVMVSAYGQKGWKWPQDSAMKLKAEEMNVIQSDAVKVGDFKTALPAVKWLVANAPDLNKSLYINAAKVYESYVKSAASEEKSAKSALKSATDGEKEAAKALAEEKSVTRAAYADSLLNMYDLRIEHFGDKPNVLNRKVIKAYIYFIKDYDRSEWLLEMFDEAFKIGGKKILDANLVAYMNVIKVNAKLKKITEEDILVRYDKISEVFEEKFKANTDAGKSNEKLIKKKAAVDGVLVDIVDINCEFVETKMAPKFEENPEDLKLVKRMFRFMLSGKCTDSPLFLSVAKQLSKAEPDFGVMKLVATKSAAIKDYGVAIEYYNKALELTEDGTKKSEIYVNQGKVYAAQGNKPKARAMYSTAITENPANKAAYNAIGNLYFQSYKQCKEEKDMVKDRLVFIVAYEQYKKAGNSKKMAAAKEQFPSKEELFNKDYTVGESLPLACWINKSVVLKTRD